MQTHPEKDLIYTGLTSLTVRILLTLLNETSKSVLHTKDKMFFFLFHMAIALNVQIVRFHIIKSNV